MHILYIQQKKRTVNQLCVHFCQLSYRLEAPSIACELTTARPTGHATSRSIKETPGRQGRKRPRSFDSPKMLDLSCILSVFFVNCKVSNISNDQNNQQNWKVWAE